MYSLDKVNQIDNKTNATVPVILFAYARPDHMSQTLNCLRENSVPLIYAFSDGARTIDKVPIVNQVRNMLRAIDWCDVVLCERENNLGLGRSILTGVTEVLNKHEAVIIFEDDLVCVPGTYDYLCAALKQYKEDDRVMSVTGWTHPGVTPSDIIDQPYFDGRAECWVWGTWRRAWHGMNEDAKTLMQKCKAQRIDVYRYGTDLPAMAAVEQQKNIWAVRFLYWHILNRGLCLRPPWSMVEHIGFDAQATNANDSSELTNPPFKPCPLVPDQWPEPVESPQCASLARQFYDIQPIESKPAGWPVRLKRGIKWVVTKVTGDPAIQNMTQKDIAKLFLPPVVIKLRRRIHLQAKIKQTEDVSQPIQKFIEWEYIPEGWSYTSNHPAVKGWNVQDVLETYKQKWPQFIAMTKSIRPLGIVHESSGGEHFDVRSHNVHMTFGYVLALAAHGSGKISILDWGGGIGHYYLIAQALLPDVEISYHCKDVSLLAIHGTELFPKQNFYSDESCFDQQYDLVMASTSLHYEENWQNLLNRLAKAAKKYLYIAQLPTVQQSSSFVFIQRPYAYGYNTEYLAWCLSRSEFLDYAGRLGLQLIREFGYGFAPRIQNAPEQNEYRGYLFSRSLHRGEHGSN